MPVIARYDGIPLNKIFRHLSNNPMFIYGLAVFIKEFLELIYYNGDGISHNDLHMSNILVNQRNIAEFISDPRYISSKTYPFRIIDFGLAIPGTISRDRVYVLERIFNYSVIFKNWKYAVYTGYHPKINRNSNIIEILESFISFVKRHIN